LKILYYDARSEKHQIIQLIVDRCVLDATSC